MYLKILLLPSRSTTGPIEILSDHLEEFVVKRPEKVSEPLECVFIHVRVTTTFGLAQAFKWLLRMVGPFEARKPF